MHFHFDNVYQTWFKKFVDCESSKKIEEQDSWHDEKIFNEFGKWNKKINSTLDFCFCVWGNYGLLIERLRDHTLRGMLHCCVCIAYCTLRATRKRILKKSTRWVGTYARCVLQLLLISCIPLSGVGIDICSICIPLGCIAEPKPLY